MNKILVAYSESRGYGSISGLFICTEDELADAIDNELYWGEILGKHSEVISKLPASAFKIKSEDQELIASLEAAFGSTDLSGRNPIDQLHEQRGERGEVEDD